MRIFSLADPLPRGTVVLEASAGTGKTYAIAALAVRFLAEGRVEVADLLVVTFSRAATAELRTRVRERLKRSAEVLAAARDGGVLPEHADELERLLCATGAEELERRAERLERAVGSFDRATIATTHEFCHGMTRGLGVLARQEPQSQLVEDLTGLADETSADLYLQRYAGGERVPPLPYRDPAGQGRGGGGARTLGRDSVRIAGRLGPDGADGAAGERVAFALGVRAEVERRKARLRMHSFDDMLSRLAEALDDPETGELARRRLAERFPVVLIDEFQDTDPIQWQVIRSAFTAPGCTLVLIGDPKQAIYAFRGADVHTYTAAVRGAADRRTLAVNHRADAPVVAAVNALFDGVRLGDEIEVPPVTAHRTGSSLSGTTGTPWASGVQVRVVPGDERTHPSAAHRAIEADLVALVTTLLAGSSPVRYEGRPVRASDLAVLVRSNWRGQAIARALSRAGVPATFSGTTSVFATDAAADWLTLLRALDQTRRPYLQRAVLTAFLGGSLADLATASDDQWATWSLHLHAWSRTLERSGVPALMAAVEQDTRLAPRLLAGHQGERLVTDHRHLAELLHRQAPGPGVRARDLADWLARAIDEAASASTERTRRLDTDARAVQVMTIHRAKGLQFPLVLLPEASHTPDAARDRGERLVLPTREGREIDVGGAGAPGRAERWQQYRHDEADEALRSIYVGLTRAQAHAVAWWAGHRQTPASPLHRLLCAPHGGPSSRPPLEHPLTRSPFDVPWLADGGIAVVPADAVAAPVAAPAGPVPGDLTARRLTRAVDQYWRRTSYSGLTAAAHDREPAPESGFVTDEAPAEVDVAPDPALSAPSPLATLPSGAAFGTLVHAVYERLDARGPAWRDALAAATAACLAAWPIADLDAPTLAEALEPSLTTPLGPLAEGTTLRDFGPGNRLTELDFEFPLDSPGATLADVGRLLAAHLPTGDVLAPYPERLADPLLTRQPLHGFLTGSVDAVLRLPSGAHLVVDYKTNRLGALGAAPESLTIGHYTRPAMAAAMMASHYPLQALLYSVALHRFLRQRQAGYDPERHLGGIAYLFVRGMAGPTTPVVAGHPLGVFSWRPPTALVLDVSRLLAGRPR